jgi:glycosyltransferase involved in cell wall biosynthesis
MLLGRMVDLPRVGLLRRKPDFITLADRARDARQWERAAQFYRKALDRNPRNPPIWVQYGHALKEAGELRDPDKLAQAEMAYRRAISLDPGVADFYVQLGHALKLQGKREDALSTYLQAIALGCSTESAAIDFTQLGWSEVHLCELQDMLATDGVETHDDRSVGRILQTTPSGLRNDVGLHLSNCPSTDPETLVESESISDVGSSYHNDVTNDKKIITHEFDRDYYLRTYPDIDNGIVDPLEHFCLFGWREGRNPCDWFSTTYYLHTHSDVADAGVNPFVHYLIWGRAEGRDTQALVISNGEILDFLKFPSRPIIIKEKMFDPNMMDIHWVIPDYSVGQGGHMNIFRIVRWLEIFGHHCTIWINHPTVHANPSKAFEDVIRHFQTIRSEVCLVSEGFLEASGDAVIATGWQTVQIVCHSQSFKDRFYFVQDYEPYFYPRGSLSILAESTYKKDLACICGGNWLESIMRERYGRWARHFWQAADESIYFPLSEPRQPNEVPRIAVYARAHSSRRAVELGLAGLQHLASQGVVFRVDLFGDQLEGFRAPFPYTVHGILSAEELGELYRAADLGLCFSATNYSVVPQEMMACGLPVVEIDVESTRAIFPDGVVTFCGPLPLEIAEAVGRLLRDPDRRRKQAEAASAWVASFSWEQSARLVEAALCEHLSESGYRSRTRSTSAAVSAKIKASVFIPTYNGGPVFQTVLDMVRRQRSPWKFEIVVIDSSSSDGTGEFCLSAADIVFEQIKQSEFGHGATRNRGVELARGEFVAFLTQDALPIDEFWLYNLVSLLEAYPMAAGAFGRHIAWPDASPFMKRHLIDHFGQFDGFPVAVSKDTDPGRWASGDRSWRQFLHFYSDNNSCLRRSVWQRIPLPSVGFGEDQLWANKIIEAGYQKVYAHAAAVYHSHDYDYEANAKRAEEEAIFLKLNFGYDLIHSKEHLEMELAKLNENDSRWAIQHGISEAALNRQLSLNRARVEGYLSGYMKCSTSEVEFKPTKGGRIVYPGRNRLPS